MDTSVNLDGELSVIWVEEDESLARTVSAYLGEHQVSVKIQPDLSQAIAAIDNYLESGNARWTEVVQAV